MITRDRQYCMTCHCEVSATLSKQIRTNGAPLLSWRCPNGDHSTRKSGMFVSQRDLEKLGVSLDDLPVIGEPAPQGVCEYRGCERPGFEEHHTAPREAFDDAELWPRELLCRYHHDQWHKRWEQYWRTKIDLERFGVTSKKT